MRAGELKGHLDAMLLAAVESDPRHGYAVIEALCQDTGGRLDRPNGTIYPALRRLEQSGLIIGSWSVMAGRRRRYYRLAAAGRKAPAGKRAGGRDFDATMSGVREGGLLCPGPA
jgi:PadR family transcriptional regulator, regulatory protein PadR